MTDTVEAKIALRIVLPTKRYLFNGSLYPGYSFIRNCFLVNKQNGTGRQRSEKGAIGKKDSHSKIEVEKKNKLTIRYFYHENIS